MSERNSSPNRAPARPIHREHSEPAMLNREQWKQIEALSRALGRWFDTRSYRPLLLLFVVSMTVFLWPLAVDVAIALFFGLPNGFRKAMGQGLLLALLAVGLRRLWRLNGIQYLSLYSGLLMVVIWIR